MPEIKVGYTPGPWVISRSGDVFGADGYEVAEAYLNLCLSLKWTNAKRKKHWGSTPGSNIDRSEEEMAANARLIAAAPEMFEAIKEHLENCGPREWSPEWKGGSCPGGDGLHEKFRQIIRKVEEEA